MKILQGQGVSKGVEHGPIYFCRRSQTLIQPDKADDPRFQGERLDRAMEQTAQQQGNQEREKNPAVFDQIGIDRERERQ